MKILGNIVDIHSRRIFYGSILIDGNIIKNIEVIDDNERVGERYIAPGLVDSHVHIESSMLTPRRFADMAVRYGNVASVCDPHEIANVLGRKGVEFMMNDAQLSDYKFFFALPSCVPATPFETNGSSFNASDMDGLVDRSVALAEMMNFPGVLFHDKNVEDEINLFKIAGKPIDGHVPGLTGEQLQQYVSAGISTDHECSNVNEALEKLNLGMMIQIREGSSARNFDALKDLFFVDNGKWIDMLMLCTDDAHPDDIRSRGYISRFLKLAADNNISIFDVYKASLVNAVKHYKLDVGCLKIGDKADFVVFNNLHDFAVNQTFINGKCVYDSALEYNKQTLKVTPINNFIDRKLNISDFSILAKTNSVRVIVANEGQLLTDEYLWNHGFSIGQEVYPSLDDDILKIAVINRYSFAPVSVGFIKGVGLKRGAMASSIAHDSHNVVVIGADDSSMVRVANALFNSKGGIALTDGDSLKHLPLPVAGIMTDSDFNDVADDYLSLLDFAKDNCSVSLQSPFMTMAFMSLLVIPKLKLGDKGLFDVQQFKFVDLFV